MIEEVPHEHPPKPEREFLHDDMLYMQMDLLRLWGQKHGLDFGDAREPPAPDCSAVLEYILSEEHAYARELRTLVHRASTEPELGATLQSFVRDPHHTDIPPELEGVLAPALDHVRVVASGTTVH